jgi:thioesterase domain-containing protein
LEKISRFVKKCLGALAASGGNNRLKTKLHSFLQEPIHRSAEIVDYSVNRRDAALEVATFAERSGAIEATLIVVKATDEATPTWMEVEHGYGWIGRAKHVIVHEVKGDHLAILREPHVTALAEVICKHQLAESAGNRSSVRSTSSTSTAKSSSTLVPTTNPKY